MLNTDFPYATIEDNGGLYLTPQTGGEIGDTPALIIYRGMPSGTPTNLVTKGERIGELWFEDFEFPIEFSRGDIFEVCAENKGDYTLTPPIGEPFDIKQVQVDS